MRSLQASKLKINLSETLKPMPPLEDLAFGKVHPLLDSQELQLRV